MLEEFEIYVEYLVVLDIEGKLFIILDLMLVMGSFMVMVYKVLLKYGWFLKVFVVLVIVLLEVFEYVKCVLLDIMEIYVGVIDRELMV